MRESSLLKGKKVLLIGGGNMGQALLAGLTASGKISPTAVTLAEPDLSKRKALSKTYGVITTALASTVWAKSDIVLLAVKPQVMRPVLKDFSPRRDQLVITVAAGLSTAFYREVLGPVSLVRVMPNTPALVGEGALAYCAARGTSARHVGLAREALAALGPLYAVKESQMDAVTALSGSGPAYVFLLAECLAAAGKAMGLSASLSTALARQTLYGAAKILKTSGEDPALLRQKVTSPGGTTAAAIQVFESSGFRALVGKALAAAKNRSQELSR